MSTSTSSLMSGLLVVAGTAAAATCTLMLYRHIELAALEHQHTLLNARLPGLREQAAKAADRVRPLDEAIVARRSRVADLQTQDKTAIEDVDRLMTQNAALIKRSEESGIKELKEFQERMREAPERRLELAKEEERSYLSETEQDERLRQLRDEVERQKQGLEQYNKQVRDERGGLDQRIAELEGRVRQLTNQLDLSNREFRPDGKVLSGEPRSGHLVIDRGWTHNLRKDSTFTIYTRRAGKIVVKGECQVVGIERDIATCRVMREVDANDPIIPGDLLHNPVYDPDHVRGFAIRGEFRTFSKTEIAKFINDAGGRVDSELTVNTDYLVAGAAADKDLEQASKLGIGIVSEDQLVEMVRPGAAPSRLAWDHIFAACAAGREFTLAGRFAPGREAVVREALRKAGGRVSGSLVAGQAGVVCGADAAAAMAEARRLGVPVIDAALFDHIVAQ